MKKEGSRVARFLYFKVPINPERKKKKKVFPADTDTSKPTPQTLDKFQQESTNNRPKRVVLQLYLSMSPFKWDTEISPFGDNYILQGCNIQTPHQPHTPIPPPPITAAFASDK